MTPEAAMIIIRAHLEKTVTEPDRQMIDIAMETMAEAVEKAKDYDELMDRDGITNPIML